MSLIRLFSLNPHFGARLRFYRENTAALSSLVESYRIALPTLLGALSSYQSRFLSFISPNKLKSPTSVGFVDQDRTLVACEGNH